MSIGTQWLAADWSRNRTAIYRALRIDPNEPDVAYATGPFTLLTTGGGEHRWIAGAVGIWRALSPHGWTPDDISDVILWNPRTGAVQLLDGDGPTLIMPHRFEPRLTVYVDGFAFFRAWADRRAATLTSLRAASKAHRVADAEPRDSDIPGALAIGEMKDIDWCGTGASILVAGAGVDPKALNRAIIRSARLPRVESLAA